MTPRTAAAPKASPRRGILRRVLRSLLLAAFFLWSIPALLLVSLRWIDPPTTALQMQRRVQSWFHDKQYQKRSKFVPMSQISPNLQHAVVAAEDARFFKHHGFDWTELQKAAAEDIEGDRTRGASTLTQQLVKNLFFGTAHSLLRKGAEASLVPVAELALGKQRILELYLNIVEWGPGIYGADAATRFYYKTPPRNIAREDAAHLAAILPAPLKRHPERMNRYSAIILTRMSQVGW